ncbi:hypothetical protein AAMO2058_000352500 [Amorphochlora amoebiformis]
MTEPKYKALNRIDKDNVRTYGGFTSNVVVSQPSSEIDRKTETHENIVLDFLQMSKWNVKRTADHVAAIDGSIIADIGSKELLEMGCNVVGDRLRFQKELGSIRARARAAWRNQVIYSAQEFREGPCRNLLPYGFPFCCVKAEPKEEYHLTHIKLAIKNTQMNNSWFGAICGYMQISDNIDLETVVDVDTSMSKPHCCKGSSGQGVVIVTTKTGELAYLRVRPGDERDVANTIQNAVEEYRLREAAMQIK